MSDHISQAEIEQLSDEWTRRLEDLLRDADYAPHELRALAAEQRTLAHVADNPGQRRGFMALAERFERAAGEERRARRLSTSVPAGFVR